MNRRAVHAEMGRGHHRRRLLAPPSSVPVATRGLGHSMREDGRGSPGAATDADRCRVYSETRNRPAAAQHPGWRRAGELFAIDCRLGIS